MYNTVIIIFNTFSWHFKQTAITSFDNMECFFLMRVPKLNSLKVSSFNEPSAAGSLFFTTTNNTTQETTEGRKTLDVEMIQFVYWIIFRSVLWGNNSNIFARFLLHF